MGILSVLVLSSLGAFFVAILYFFLSAILVPIFRWIYRIKNKIIGPPRIKGLTSSQAAHLQSCLRDENQTLHFYGQQLTQVPPILLTNYKWRVLHLNSNLLRSLPSNVWSTQSSSLRELILSHNLLSSSSAFPSDLSLLANLNKLSLQHNLLSSIPPVLLQIHALKTLDLSFNRLSLFPLTTDKTEVEEVWPILGWLHLSHNRIQKVPSWALNENLRGLEIAHNSLVEFPSLDHCSILQELNLSHNLTLFTSIQPDTLSRAFSSLQLLSRIDISRTNLHTLPSQTWPLRLREFLASGNRLESLPESITTLRQLRVLDVSRNSLRRLPAGLWHLSRLRRISLSVNRLERFPEPEPNRDLFFPELKELMLGGNLFTCLPEAFKKLPQLQRISVAQNPRLTSVPLPLPKTVQVMVASDCPLLNWEWTPQLWPKDNFDKLEELLVAGTLITAAPPHLLPASLEAFETSESSHSQQTETSQDKKSNYRKQTGDSNVHCGYAHTRGRRSFMEDRFSEAEVYLKREKDGTVEGRALYFGMFDGHSGEKVANYCASRFHLLLQQQLFLSSSTLSSSSSDPISEAITSAFAKAQEEIEQLHLNGQLTVDGSTALVCLLVRGDSLSNLSQGEQKHRLYIANVGDTRAVLCWDAHEDLKGLSHNLNSREKDKICLKRLSVDHRSGTTDLGFEHNRDEEDSNDSIEDNTNINDDVGVDGNQNGSNSGTPEWERIVRGGGFVSENGRVKGIMEISRGLGDLDLQPHVSSLPTVSKVLLPAKAGGLDARYRLILGCDGVWDVLTDREAVQIVQSVDISKGARLLRDYSFMMYSTDNISVALVDF